MSANYGAIPGKNEMINFIQKSIDNGVTFFDTAEVYGHYTNEALLGEALTPYKNDVIIATKFGFDLDPNKKQQNQTVNSRSEHIRKQIEGSLKRLRTDCIDLYYQHHVDQNVPIEEVSGTIQDLIKEGKVKYWGLSEGGAETITNRLRSIQPARKRIFNRNH